ncbi:MAG: hypothetical protein JW816_00230 [Candidatus Buchananbacteria bacterium]|nr:hypothetical protein [Candidatus Buchananbacteria bacterium]
MLLLKLKKCYNLDRNRGYVALISVLLVGAVGLVIVLSLVSLGLGLSKSGLVLQQSNQAKALANACAAEALQQVRDSTPFTGSGNLSLGLGSCSYTVTSQGGQDRTVIATGTVGNVIRKVKVIIDKITPDIQVVTWQEVADF